MLVPKVGLVDGMILSTHQEWRKAHKEEVKRKKDKAVKSAK
jgi:hypothetical protein